MSHRLGIPHFWMNRVIIPGVFAFVATVFHSIGHLLVVEVEHLTMFGIPEGGFMVSVYVFIAVNLVLYGVEQDKFCSRRLC